MKKTAPFNHMFNSTKGERQIRIGYVIAFILLLLSCLITLYMNRRMQRHAQLVEHTNKVINSLESMLSRVKDGETGVRGYLVTNNKDFLAPYYGSYDAADSIFGVIKTLTIDNPEQQSRLVALKNDLEKRAEISRLNIAEFERGGGRLTDSSNQLMLASAITMNRLRHSVSDLQQVEKTLLEQREIEFNSSIHSLNLITVISLFLAALLVIVGYKIYSRENKSKRRADEEYQRQLQNRINELNKVNEELVKMRSEEKFAATGRIARTIAHEVRNPLTNINLASEQLKAELKNEDHNYLFDMIARNSSRINHLISELLNSTKFSELQYEEVKLTDLLDEVLQDASDRIELSNVEVIRLYEADRKVTVDKGKIKIAFLNIIINALEAMAGSKSGKLCIETKMQDEKCKISISDNGTGMDQESLTRLFEPYFTTRPNGNGLGLTNTQNIILNHKGEIFVESEKGKGTSFFISLDVA